MAWQGQLVVATVAIVTTWIAYTSQIFILWHFLGGPSVHTVLVLVPFNVFVIMIYVNYALVSLTDPGAVPPNWAPDEQHGGFMEVKRSTHAPRFCKTCNNYKPPRAHHCRQCGRCVLKMDHHCPWINNCVGFANYGHFIRFITYVQISSIYLFVLLCCRLARVVSDLKNIGVHPSALEAAFLAINLVLTAAAMITVGILSGYHVYCLTTNTTTIEGWEKGTTLTIQSLGRIRKVKYPYHLGVYKNICAVLGDQPILWLWPQRMKGTGLYFPIQTKHLWNAGSQEEEEEEGDDDRKSERKDHHRMSAMTYQTETTAVASTTVIKVEDDEKESGHVAMTEPARLHTRASGATLRTSEYYYYHTRPTTPASVATFASTTTLVDSRMLSKACSKETFELDRRSSYNNR